MRSFQVLKAKEFEKWLLKQQPKIRALVVARLDLLSIAHFGNHKKFKGLIELRWKNGMRVYAFIWNNLVIVILNGGNKNAQEKDIQKAVKIRNEITEGSRTI